MILRKITLGYIPVMALALFLIDIESSRSLARERVFRDRLNPINVYNDVEFISRYRVCPDRRESFNFPESINNLIAFKSCHHSISSRTTVLCNWFFPNCGCIVTWNISAISLPNATARYQMHYVTMPHNILYFQTNLSS